VLPLAGLLLAGIAGLVLCCGVGVDVPERTLFGDPGDSFFNLWILEHIFREGSGGLSALEQTRILAPETGIFWYSDNLFTLSPPYVMARLARVSRLAAYYGTHVFWLVFQLLAGWSLLCEIHRMFSRPDCKSLRIRLWGQGLCVLMMTFQPARMWGMQHFQNHAIGYWILCLTFALRHARKRDTASLWGMMLTACALLASSPYYAVLAVPVGLGWLLALLGDPETNWRRLILQQGPFLLLPFLAMLPLLSGYLAAGSRTYPKEELLRRSWTLSDLLPPAWGGFDQGYLGVGLLLGGLMVFVWIGVFTRSELGRWMRRRGFWLFLGLLGITLIKAKEIYAFTAWLRLFLQGWAMVWLIRKMRSGATGAGRAGFLLLLCLILVAGTAMGPGTFFGPKAIDPSVWGILHRILPGYAGMRDLIRFVPLVGVCITALLFAGACWRMSPSLWWAVCFLGILGTPELLSYSPNRTPIDPDTIELNPQASTFFQSISGDVLVVPCAPFHRNPNTMLCWQPFPNLRLLNGYTGRRTEAFDQLLSAENHFGRGSPQQWDMAVKLGARWGVILKEWVPQATEELLQERYPVVFEDTSLLVLRLTPKGGFD
jgi:hypothetical protein